MNQETPTAPGLSRFVSLHDTRPIPTTWEEIVTEITGLTHANLTRLYRENLAAIDAAVSERNTELEKVLQDKKKRLKASQPAFIVAVELSGGRSLQHIVRYTNHVMVDIDGLPSDQFDRVLSLVRADAHSMLTYTTISGRGIRIVCRVEGVTNATQHTAAWKVVNFYFSRLTGVKIDEQCKNVTRMSVISHDAHAQYRPDALTFGQEEIRRELELSREKKNLQRKDRRAHAAPRPITPATAYKHIAKQLQNDGIRYEPGSYNNFVSRTLYWMNRYGVAQEAAHAWAEKTFNDYPADSLHAIVNSCYAQTAQHGTEELPPRKRKASMEEIEAFVGNHIRLRKNMLTHQIECQWRNDCWERFTDHIENSLWCSMQRDGPEVDFFKLHTLLTGDYVQEYHPLTQYLESLPAWDGTTDHIALLSSLVHIKNGPQDTTFAQILKRWLVAMIAGALNEDVVNQVILVLLGRQGCYKTSFMQNLLPPELRGYYITKANSQRMTKDDLFTMTEYLVINLEEIETMPPSELNQLKAMITQLFVDERPPYGRNKVHLPHVASFVATGNSLQFLTDDTGNRRWIPFEVESIDNPWEQNIPYAGIYAQAYALYRNGFRYWFTDAEVQALQSHVKQFEVPKPEYELLGTYFRKPLPTERAVYLTCSQIVARFSSIGLRLSAAKVGRVLRELGYQQVHTRNGNYWLVKERTSDEVQHVLPESQIVKDVKDVKDIS